MASLVIYIAHKHVSRSITDTLWIAGIVLAVLFSAMQYQNFIWGFQIQFFGFELAAMASIACIVLGRRNARGVAAAIAFAAIAVYTLASGMLIPLISIPLAFWTGRSWKQVAALSAAAVVLLASYLYGYVTPSDHSDPLITVLNPGALVYVMIELGNPFGQLVHTFYSGSFNHWEAGFGAVGIGLFATAALIQFRRGRAVGRCALVFLSVAAFVVGTAFLIALGRFKFGTGQALASRYTSLALLFWLSLVMLAIIEIREWRPVWRLVAVALSLPCLFVVASAQASFVKTGLAWALPRREAMTALLADVDDRDALGRVFPDAARPGEEAPKLRVRHLALFADGWSAWLGTPLFDHVRLGNPSECRGDIDQVFALPVSKSPQWRITGWAWDRARDSPPERVVLADNAGRVVGYALTGYPPKAGSARGSGWRGHFVGDKPIKAYALIDREQTACPLAAAPDAP